MSFEELEYKRKLNQSYQICLQELYEPISDWEDKIEEMKYTIDPITRKPKNCYNFVLDFPDQIQIPDSKHTYVFRRSHFYNKFKNPQSRLKQDLIEYYNKKGYMIDLFKDVQLNKWCLKLYWTNTSIYAP